MIRIDPIGGAADYHRWPVTSENDSIYWAGLNKGKRSFAADFRDPRAHELIRDLILEAGIVVTNAAGRTWLEDVALATAGNLGYLAEAQLGLPERGRIGNAVFGTYGADFETSDGARIMIVALTSRHFRDLAKLTGTTAAITALEGALGVDFSYEGDRYTHREVLTGLLAPWFRGRTAGQVETALSGTSVLHERYRTFAELATDPRVTHNPLFQPLDQPRLGAHLAPSTPMSFNGVHPPVRPAPANGQDTAAVLAEHLGLTPDEIDQLVAAGTIRITDKESA